MLLKYSLKGWYPFELLLGSGFITREINKMHPEHPFYFDNLFVFVLTKGYTPNNSFLHLSPLPFGYVGCYSRNVDKDVPVIVKENIRYYIFCCAPLKMSFIRSA